VLARPAGLPSDYTGFCTRESAGAGATRSEELGLETGLSIRAGAVTGRLSGHVAVPAH
jgi:hypothetical protein